MAHRELLGFIRAARAGDASAQLALGRHYLLGGKGLPQNFTSALYWLDRAAQQGVEDAWLLIGTHIPYEAARQATNMPQLLQWYERASDAGVKQAGAVFARLVLDGGRQQPPSVLEKANRALHAAAQAGAHILGPQHRHAARQEPAVDAGTAAARHAMAERAWALADYAAFLHWSLPLARELIRRARRPARTGMSAVASS